MCNEIRNITKNISRNVTSTVSINSEDKMDYSISDTVLLVIILLFLIVFDCCHCANRSKQKLFEILAIKKWKIID